MKRVNLITFAFYVPMYGSGAFSFEKVETGEDQYTLCTYMGVPEGTSEIISDSVKISRTNFDNILEFINQELLDYNGTYGLYGCSISLYNGDELVKEYLEDIVDYEKFIKILYTVINTYANEMSQYLW